MEDKTLDIYSKIYDVIGDIAKESYDDGWCASNVDKPHDGPDYDVVAGTTKTVIELFSAELDKAVKTAVENMRDKIIEETEKEAFKTEITYGDNVIPQDWVKIDNVWIWFEAFHRGIDWHGLPGYVYKKPDETFVAPFRGELINVVNDCKKEYREYHALSQPTNQVSEGK